VEFVLLSRARRSSGVTSSKRPSAPGGSPQNAMARLAVLRTKLVIEQRSYRPLRCRSYNSPAALDFLWARAAKNRSSPRIKGGNFGL
jgi:hypothetical protein